MKKLFFVLGSLMISVFAVAQDFEGKVLFDIAVAKDVDPQMQQMMPKEGLMYVKDGNSRMEMTTGMGSKNITISDQKAKVATTLIDMMGQKIALKTDLTEGEKAAEGSVVTVTKKTKKIAGYTVTQAFIESKGTDGESVKNEIWFAKDLKIKSNIPGASGKIDGAVLQYNVNQKGANLTLTAKEVTKETVDDSKFVIPEGYKVTTMEELMKSMGGGK